MDISKEKRIHTEKNFLSCLHSKSLVIQKCTYEHVSCIFINKIGRYCTAEERLYTGTRVSTEKRNLQIQLYLS